MTAIYPLMSDHFSLSCSYPVSKDGRVVQGGSLRYCSLRRRGFEPHSLHFDFLFCLCPFFNYILLFIPALSL